MQKKKKTRNESPKFYEMDGALRAYSNRSIVLAGIMGLIALIAVVGFFLVRLEPATVIRISSDGEASVVIPYQTGKLTSCHRCWPQAHPRRRLKMTNSTSSRPFSTVI